MDEETRAELQKAHRMLGGLQNRITLLEKMNSAAQYNFAILQEQVMKFAANLGDMQKQYLKLLEKLQS